MDLKEEVLPSFGQDRRQMFVFETDPSKASYRAPPESREPLSRANPKTWWPLSPPRFQRTRRLRWRSRIKEA